MEVIIFYLCSGLTPQSLGLSGLPTATTANSSLSSSSLMSSSQESANLSSLLSQALSSSSSSNPNIATTSTTPNEAPLPLPLAVSSNHTNIPPSNIVANAQKLVQQSVARQITVSSRQ